jgi:hypothetical protein
MSAATTNSDGRSRTSASNGAHSNGSKTPQGLLAQSLAQLKHGIKAWTPVLPTEREEDWAELRHGINEDWHPIGRIAEELAYCLAMAFWQRRRLYRHEKELVLHRAKERMTPSLWSHRDDDEEGECSNSVIWKGGQAALRKEIAVCETVLSMLEMLAHEPGATPFASDDALLLVDRILRNALKKDDPLPALSEPAGGWTVSAIRELVTELASDCRKKPDGILSTVYREAKEHLENAQYQLDQVIHHVDQSSLPDHNHDSSRLWDYDRRHLNTALRCIHELQRLQAARQGQPVAPPAALDVTVTHQFDADS